MQKNIIILKECTKIEFKKKFSSLVTSVIVVVVRIVGVSVQTHRGGKTARQVATERQGLRRLSKRRRSSTT